VPVALPKKVRVAPRGLVSQSAGLADGGVADLGESVADILVTRRVR
jgi:hypothetical protein